LYHLHNSGSVSMAKLCAISRVPLFIHQPLHCFASSPWVENRLSRQVRFCISPFSFIRQGRSCLLLGTWPYGLALRQGWQCSSQESHVAGGIASRMRSRQ
jgi:hypothetical protein